MEHSADRQETQRFQRLLRTIREEAGVRQVDLAASLGVPQSFVSKYESGERRLGVVEAMRVCVALETSLPDVLHRFSANDLESS